MSFPTGVIDMALIALIAANVVGILTYAINARLKARREKRHIDAINNAIIEYFRKTGVQVAADCSSLKRGMGYTAFVESEPMKRFRLSHIIEATLREHIYKTCGLELEKIYWRFPIRNALPDVAEAADTAAVDAAADPAPQISDEYINEGLEHYRDIPKTEATELDWEHFERAATDGQEKKAAASDIPRKE